MTKEQAKESAAASGVGDNETTVGSRDEATATSIAAAGSPQEDVVTAAASAAAQSSDNANDNEGGRAATASGAMGDGPPTPRTDTTSRPTTTTTTNTVTTATRKRPRNNDAKTRRIRITLLHSTAYTSALHEYMHPVHGDRDVLAASLLKCCGFVRDAPSFFAVTPPLLATRKHMERYGHDGTYLNLLEFHTPPPSGDDDGSRRIILPQYDHDFLDRYGLVDDCSLPTTVAGRAALWKYCRYVAGASLHGARILLSNKTDVAINWGGGRHHARSAEAGGFCYVNDAVLAMNYVRRRYNNSSNDDDGQGQEAIKAKILYLDIDIHHGNGVQDAFYETPSVLTCSFHRQTPGFYPGQTGHVTEKGRGSGLGYNLNVPMPRGTTDAEFVSVYKYALEKLMVSYEPNVVVLCVGADGLACDPLVGRTDGEGWNLTTRGLAACVRETALACASSSGPVKTKKKLLVLGGGGYHDARTARAFVVCTAAACAGARPTMVEELPRDVPDHEHWLRYGPDFTLHTGGDDCDGTSTTNTAPPPGGGEGGVPRVDDDNGGNNVDDEEGEDDGRTNPSIGEKKKEQQRQPRSATDQAMMEDGRRAIDLAAAYIKGRKERRLRDQYRSFEEIRKEEEAWW